jgi:hypothetical protein
VKVGGTIVSYSAHFSTLKKSVKDKIGKHNTYIARMRENAYKILAEKSDENRQFGISGRT